MKVRWLVLVAAISASWLAAYFLWPLMVLPFSNPLGIVGTLSAAQFNPANNVVRYGVFLIAPALGFIAAFAAPMDERMLDFLHDGESLSAANTYLMTGKIWTGSFFVHGWFYDIGRPLAAWWIFGHRTIGALRLFNAMSDHATFSALLALLAALTWASWRGTGGARALVCFAAMLVLYGATEDGLQRPNLRDFSAFVIAAVCVIAVTRSSWWLAAIAGLLAGAGMFNTIERGAYVTLASLCVLLLLLVVRRERRDLTSLVAFATGFFVTLLAARLAVGPTEFRAFRHGFAYWTRHKELMDGFIYPQPSAVAFTTLPLVMNALSFLGWAAALPSYVREKQWHRLAVNTFLVAAACLYFRSALGRADDSHVRYVATLAYVAFAWTVANWLPKRALRFTASLTLASLALLALIACITLIKSRRDLAHFASRAREFVARDDNAFLTPLDRANVAAMQKRFADDACTFVEMPAPAIHYLLRKPSCGRFYFAWFATAVPHQRELIATLERLKPLRVMLERDGAPGIDGFTPAQLFSELDAYLHATYPAEPRAERDNGLGPADWLTGRRRE